MPIKPENRARYPKDWPRGWILKPALETERHLCPACIASIQAMPKMCGQGYDCNGGPGCLSDHKWRRLTQCRPQTEVYIDHDQVIPQ